MLTDGQHRLFVVFYLKQRQTKKQVARIRLFPKVDIYCTVLRFTQREMGVARIHQNWRVNKLVRVIPENGRPKH